MAPKEGPPDEDAAPSPFTTTTLERVLDVDPSTIEVTRKAEEGLVYKMVCEMTVLLLLLFVVAGECGLELGKLTLTCCFGM